MGTGPAADEHSTESDSTELDCAEFDIVVAGSGAAGMTAALTAAHRGATVVVLEKTGSFGGSTARSGGGIWAPGNTVLRRAGVADSPSLARSYLAYVAGEDVPAELRDALLEHGPAMLDFVLAATPLRLAWVPGYADYYPEAPGGLASGRSIEPVPFNGSVLGRELARLNRPYLPVPNGVVVTQADYRWLTLGPRHPRAIRASIRVAGRLARSRLLGQRMLSLGQALAAGLRAGLLAREVPVWLDCPLTDLEVTDGRVTGVRAVRDGKPVLIRARRGVLIATGGFERNEQMRRQYQQAPIGTDWTTGGSGNTGDGIAAGQRLGAATGLMDDAWWGPSIPLPRGPYFCLAERNLPGCVMVNGAGRRFVNESAPYVDAVHAMYAANAADNPHIPAWLVFDHRYRDRYVFAGLPPGRPLPRRWYAAGAVFRAPDLGKLAAAIGVDPDGLAQTVARFNEFARTGRDAEFGRGDSAYDRYYGDPRVRPNPNLAPLDRAPFYAVKIVPGDLGTKGGLRTDARARVLRPDSSLIPGLYAAGNASASVMGHSYAGAGATIGPAMTFGYLAALDLTPDTAGLSALLAPAPSHVSAIATASLSGQRTAPIPGSLTRSSRCRQSRRAAKPASVREDAHMAYAARENSGISERLIGPEPPEEFIRASRARLDALFQEKFAQRERLRNEQRRMSEAPATLLRNLAKDDAATQNAVKEARARSKKLSERAVPAPHRAKVKSRAHLGSINITFVPPYPWPWEWSATTGSATAGVSSDNKNGTMSFDAWTGDDGKTASCAVAVGSYFQPVADAGIMDVAADPAFNYVWDSDNVFDNSHTHAFLGLYVGEYTLGGEFVRAVVDQQITLWDSGGGSDQGTNSGYPLFASTPVDSDHFYEIWVWAGGDAEADGWSLFWGSAALSAASLAVPSISIAAY